MASDALPGMMSLKAGADEHVPGMRAHLDGCPACDEDHASLLAFVSAAR
jgi:hypothetical protein